MNLQDVGVCFVKLVVLSIESFYNENPIILGY